MDTRCAIDDAKNLKDSLQRLGKAFDEEVRFLSEECGESAEKTKHLLINYLLQTGRR